MKSALLTQLALCACPSLLAVTAATTVPQTWHAVHRTTTAAHPHRIGPSRNRRPENCVVRRKTDSSAPADPAFVQGLTNLGNNPALGKVGDGLQVALADPAQQQSNVGAEWNSPAFPGGPGGGLILPTQPGSPTNPEGPGGTGPATGVVPEPSNWAFMLIGFGAIGSAVRSSTRRRARHEAVAVAGGATGLAAALDLGASGTLAAAKTGTFGAHAIRAALLKKVGICVCSAAALSTTVATVPPLRHALYAAAVPTAERSLPAACISSAPGEPRR